MKSDEQVRADILSELAWDPSIRATRIGVAVRNGVVIVSRRFEPRFDRHAIERAVRRVAGDVKVQHEWVELPTTLHSWAMHAPARGNDASTPETSAVAPARVTASTTHEGH